ncbi:LysR substrate-binding domain-containing protein [Microvirga sp. 2MCAF38]|uniref:LysR substrate-binding domain-containing protein n=1 Tax=Microvirga sp. 2MCAF38 TaxID=3232989 RepID=UPI003F9D28F4
MKLPPMSAIRVFEAAARHRSFTRAAEELGMTQAAVSYQIKVLEDRIGDPLFVRLPRQVVLTEKGMRLAPAVSEAFGILESAFAEVDESVRSVLSITVLTTFAASVLIPRLGRFQALRPDVAIQIATGGEVVDLARSKFDIGIRSGLGEWPGLEAHFLIPNHFTAACSPALLEGHSITTPADILKLPILSPGDLWWLDWFRAAGVEGVDLSDRPDNSLGVQHFEGLAAVAGQGMALVNPSFFATEFASGQLVQPFDIVARSDRDYWLVYPKAKRRSTKIKAFRDWLLRELAEGPKLTGR